MPSLPDWLNEIAAQEGLGNDVKEKAELDELWIENFIDDLTVAVALRQWDEAVRFIEDGKFVFLKTSGFISLAIFSC